MSETLRPSYSAVGFAILYLVASAGAASPFAPQETSEPVITGMVCASVPQGELPQLLSAIEKAGGLASRPTDTDGQNERDSHCYSQEFPLAIQVPDGLEAWSVERIQALGYPANYGMGTAGGSGDIRAAFDSSDFFSGPLTPNNFSAVRKELECKLRTRYEKYFDKVNFSSCKYVAYPDDGFCWVISVLGHSATSAGFNPAKLSGLISDRYWFRADIEIWMGYFPHFRDLSGNDLGSTLKVHLSVNSSEFARFPPNQQPEPDKYHEIDDFDPSADIDSIDDALNDRGMGILIETKLICGSS